MDKATQVFNKLAGIQANMYKTMKDPILKMLNSRTTREMMTNIDNTWQKTLGVSGGGVKNILVKTKTSKGHQALVDKAVMRNIK